MAEQEITREYIIETLKRLAEETDKVVGRSALMKEGINQYQIDKHINEGLTELKRQLGLKISRQEDPHDPFELLNKLDELVTEKKKLPVWKDLERACGATQKVWLGHSGNKGITGVFEWYREWLKSDRPESENIEIVDNYFIKEPTPKFATTKYKEKSGVILYGKKDPGKIRYGRPFHFGNMLFEPVNEQGVVFLFGMISRFMGFTIKHIQTEFPDCEALQHFPDGSTQEVKIEFEFKSSQYNHPTVGCDYIVCWKDNLKDRSPLPVIELRQTVKQLRKMDLSGLAPIK